MREILFRGKRKNGEWVYGHYILWDNKHCIYDGIYYEVIPSTIGQYTGLTANGKMIFEGDIVKCRHEWSGKNIDFTVADLLAMSIPTEIELQEEFENQNIRNAYGKHIGENHTRKCFYYYRNYVVEYFALNGRYRLRNGSVFHDMTASYMSNRNAEVIGTIHDNPERLKGGADNG